MKLKGSFFIVTGGASGLGEATVRALHNGGGGVLICDRDNERGKALAAELGEASVFLSTDVASEADGQAAINLALERFGALHGLINCAGVADGIKVLGRDGPHPLERFTRTLTVNLVGSFNMIRLATEAMAVNQPGEDGERGIIINTASIAAWEGQIGQAAYAASKAGVVGMTLPMARELAAHGIRVNTLAPGLFLTPMMMALPEEVQNALGEATPFPKRLGKPEEFAALVLQVIDNVMMNGETLRLDGGVRLAAR
jgi:NAD(P)-dependent dehydrogenase (short-subunit alcohol dehydrogenase family)